MIRWECKRFDELTNSQLYSILQLRNEVFVVEQNCVYQDCDEKDIQSYHLTGWWEAKLIAYCRIVPPGISYENAPSIGRVVTAYSHRKRNIGKQLVAYAINTISDLFGNCKIIISAQLYLQKFYESFHFISAGPVYLEDGIEHIQMVRISPTGNNTSH
ncbi:MAG: GNAT family N-acetyltransferase [Ginsengibacter sp.]